MFERLTDRARQSIALAQESAVGLGHTYIGCEHLLLGLVLEGTGVAAVVLRDHGIDAGIVRAAIVETFGESTSTISDGDALASLGIDLEEVRRRLEESFGPNALPSADRPPFTPRARDALERTVHESEALYHGYVGTEHVLLALLFDDGNFARKIVVDRNVDVAALRAQILELAATDYLRIKATEERHRKLFQLALPDNLHVFADVGVARVKEVSARNAATKVFADDYDAAVATAERALASKGLVLDD